MDKKRKFRNDFVMPAVVGSAVCAVIIGVVVAFLAESWQYGLVAFAATVLLTIVDGILTTIIAKVYSAIHNGVSKKRGPNT